MLALAGLTISVPRDSEPDADPLSSVAGGRSPKPSCANQVCPDGRAELISLTIFEGVSDLASSDGLLGICSVVPVASCFLLSKNDLDIPSSNVFTGMSTAASILARGGEGSL